MTVLHFTFYCCHMFAQNDEEDIKATIKEINKDSDIISKKDLNFDGFVKVLDKGMELYLKMFTSSNIYCMNLFIFLWPKLVK